VKRTLLLSLVVPLLALPAVSQALTLSAEPDDCFSSIEDDCIGGVYTLEVDDLGGGTYLARYTMDLSPGLEVPATTIEQIEFKVASGYDAISIELAPGGADNWLPVDGPLGAAGCNGNNDGFICIDAVNPVAISPTTFSWEVQFNAAGLLAEDSWHIGARFASPNHQRGWLLSASSNPIPEPSSYLMFGIGAAIVGYAIRRSAA
jgi:hypothetical protein